MLRWLTFIAMVFALVLSGAGYAYADQPDTNSTEAVVQSELTQVSKEVSTQIDSTSQRTPADTQQVSRGSNTSRSIIAGSMKYIGVPYRYGGKSVKGFDCSGFVGYVFGMFDVKLPRSSREQARIGTHVDKTALIPADLVFFKTGGSSRINHVGIYIGDSRFIHASSSRGITVSALNEKYYRYSYYGARRVLGQ